MKQLLGGVSQLMMCGLDHRDDDDDNDYRNGDANDNSHFHIFPPYYQRNNNEVNDNDVISSKFNPPHVLAYSVGTTTETLC